MQSQKMVGVDTIIAYNTFVAIIKSNFSVSNPNKTVKKTNLPWITKGTKTLFKSEISYSERKIL